MLEVLKNILLKTNMLCFKFQSFGMNANYVILAVFVMEMRGDYVSKIWHYVTGNLTGRKIWHCDLIASQVS